VPSFKQVDKKYIENNKAPKPKGPQQREHTYPRQRERMDREIESLRRADSPKPRVEETVVEKMTPRPFDNLESIEHVPQLPNSSLPRGGREGAEALEALKATKRLEAAMVKEHMKASSMKGCQKIAEDLEDHLLLKEVNLPVVDTLSVMPEFQKHLARRLRNRGARETNPKTFLMESLLIEDPTPYMEEFAAMTHFIKADDIEVPEVFEVLAEPEDGLAVGSSRVDT
ncbi:hypothetical protein L218DRAFT_1034296, partial [Marasmius fiardii PR-910]